MLADQKEETKAPLNATFRQSGGGQGSQNAIVMMQAALKQQSAIPLHMHKRVKLPVFGCDDVICDSEFPSADELNFFPHTRNIKLKKIYYKNGFENALKAIRFEFTYGIASPLFEVEDKIHKL